MPPRKNIEGASNFPGKALIVSFHDVTPLTYEAFASWAKHLESVGVARLTWFVVPFWHGKIRLRPESACAQWLRRRQSCGDDMILHGLTHQWDKSTAFGVRASCKSLFIRRVYTAMESEFLDLEPTVLRQRIRRARSLLEDAGIRPVGFVAPAWIFPRDQHSFLGQVGFRLTESYKRIHALHAPRSFHSPVLTASARAPWRVFLSRCVVPALERLWAEAPVVRVAIHPADLEHPPVRHLMYSVVQRLRRVREPHTLSSWAATVGL